MVKKEKKSKVRDIEEFSNRDEEEVYTLSGDEPDQDILEQTNYREHIIYRDDFNQCLDKIKALKELLNEENASEKPTQVILDSLAEKISEMIRELK